MRPPMEVSVERRRRNRSLVAGDLAALIVTAGLGGWVVVSGVHPGAALLLVPCVAVGVSYLLPRSLAALVLADLLLVGTVVILAIGWVGFLYLPSLVLLVIATVQE